MRRLIVLIGLAVVVVGAGGLYMFKREMVMELYEANILGFGTAKTPQECADRFRKAVEKRNYKMAAKYCTKDYAEQMIKAGEAGKELGKAIDDLTFRMEKDGVLTSEVEVILFLNDPLPKAITLTPQAGTDTEAVAAIDVNKPTLKTPNPGTWKIDMLFIQGFYAEQGSRVKMVKQADGGWKLDFVVTPAVRQRFDRVVTVHKDYVNALTKMSEEVRTERTTKVEVDRRLKELLDEAVNNKR